MQWVCSHQFGFMYLMVCYHQTVRSIDLANPMSDRAGISVCAFMYQT